MTLRQKLSVLSNRFYGGIRWPEPLVAGIYYTTSRDDLELYQIVDVVDGKVYTRYCDSSKTEVISEWDEDGFTTKGFGPKRVYVGEWIFSLTDK